MLMVIVLFIILLAIIAIIIAVSVMMKNRRLSQALLKIEQHDMAIKPHDELDILNDHSLYNIFLSDKEFCVSDNSTEQKKVKFYASAPTLGVEIPSDKAKYLSYDQICRYVNLLYTNNSDNFFVLEDTQGKVIQFFHDGISEVIEIDVPAQGGSFAGEFTNLDNVKFCIRGFFDNVDIPFNYPLKFKPYAY